MNSQKTPHTSPLRASYGVSFFSYLMKIYREISRPHCIVIPTLAAQGHAPLYTDVTPAVLQERIWTQCIDYWFIGNKQWLLSIACVPTSISQAKHLRDESAWIICEIVARTQGGHREQCSIFKRICISIGLRLQQLCKQSPIIISGNENHLPFWCWV